MSHPRILARLCLVIILLTCCITLILSKGRPYHIGFAQYESAVPDGSTVRLTARIADKIRSRDGTTLVLDVSQLAYRNKTYPADKLYLFRENPTALRIGDQIEAGGTLRYYEHARNPGNFDRHFYYGVRGVQARLIPGYLQCHKRTGFPIKEWIFQRASSAHDALLEGMGDRDGSVLSSMLLGRKSLIDGDIRRLYQKNGIAHLLAISGLHLSLLGWGLYRFLNRIGLRGWPGSVITFLAMALYMTVTGFSVSVFRATVMLVIRILAERSGRAYHGMTSLGTAVVLILMRSPWYLWDASFQLSVSAVCALYLFAGETEAYGWLSRLKAGLRVSASVFAFTLPVTLWHFFEISPYAVILNLIVIPLMPVAITAGAAGMLLACCLPIAGKILSVPAFMVSRLVLRIYEGVCSVAQVLPLSRLCTGRPPVILIIAFYGAMTAICLLIRSGHGGLRSAARRAKAAYVGLALSFAAILAYHPLCRAISDDTEIMMLDIGQGDCLYVDDGHGRNYLIDAGSSSVEGVTEQRIEPCLLSRGINRIDAVFISHGDADHMNAVESILNSPGPSLHLGRLIMTEPAYRDTALEDLRSAAEEHGIPCETIRFGQQIRSSDVLLECLGPPAADTAKTRPEPGNEASMILQLQRGAFRMLFTGDAEGEGEKALTDVLSGRDPLTVLKVAHHGSRNSSQDAFLQQTEPMLALISAGRNNLYGHPHGETLKRLEQNGCRIIRTDESGCITILTDGDKMRMTKTVR